jgi:phenylpyruvate tautomerase PptA (4-oxalocrotonate tautomerase family)
MPTIDITAPEDLFPAEVHRQLAEELTTALLQAEGAPLAPPFLENTAAYLHLLPAGAVHTAGTAAARTVRVQVLTPPDALDREGQIRFVAEATDIVARLAQDPTQRSRTWVLLTEAVDGGWGVAGRALDSAFFAGARRS